MVRTAKHPEPCAQGGPGLPTARRRTWSPSVLAVKTVLAMTPRGRETSGPRERSLRSLLREGVRTMSRRLRGGSHRVPEPLVILSFGSRRAFASPKADLRGAPYAPQDGCRKELPQAGCRKEGVRP